MLGQKEKYHDRRGRPDELKVEKVIHLSMTMKNLKQSSLLLLVVLTFLR